MSKRLYCRLPADRPRVKLRSMGDATPG